MCFDTVETEAQRKGRQEVYREIGWVLSAGLSVVIAVSSFLLWFKVFPHSAAILRLSSPATAALLLHHSIWTVLAIHKWLQAASSSPYPKQEGSEEEDAVHTTCDKCGMLRRRRTHHCGVCRKCTPRMDHHCPYLNRCIGLGNLSCYVRLHMAITYCSLWAFSSALVVLWSGEGDGESDRTAAGSILIFSSIAGVNCGCLLGWSLMLSARGLTHVEYAKRGGWKGGGMGPWPSSARLGMTSLKSLWGLGAQGWLPWFLSGD